LIRLLTTLPSALVSASSNSLAPDMAWHSSCRTWRGTAATITTLRAGDRRAAQVAGGHELNERTTGQAHKRASHLTSRRQPIQGTTGLPDLQHESAREREVRILRRLTRPRALGSRFYVSP